MAYSIHVAGTGTLRSQDITSRLAEYDCPLAFAQLRAIETLEARGTPYANADFDVLSRALSVLRQLRHQNHTSSDVPHAIIETARLSACESKLPQTIYLTDDPHAKHVHAAAGDLHWNASLVSEPYKLLGAVVTVMPFTDPVAGWLAW